MKRSIARKRRIVRARHVQELQAVVASVQARDQVLALEDNASRLRGLRSQLYDVSGSANGAAMAAQRELAARLESAGLQLAGAIHDAKARATLREGERLTATREKEIAERLKDRATRQLETRIELRQQAMARVIKRADWEDRS